MNKLKYNIDDEVKFSLEMNGRTFNVKGEVKIIDAYGTFEQKEEPSYDVMINNPLEPSQQILIKHIRESSLEND